MSILFLKGIDKHRIVDHSYTNEKFKDSKANI